MKLDDAIFDACVVIMSLFLVQNIRERTLRICLSRLYFPVRTTPACQQTPALEAQLGRCACLFDRLTMPNKALKPASAVPLEKEQFRHRHRSHCRPWRSHQRVPALRLQQRALQRYRRALAGKAMRRDLLFRNRAITITSSFGVLVVAAPPDAPLIASLGGTVKPLICTPEAVQSARIGGIGVADDAVLEHKRAHAGSVADVRGSIRSAHGREPHDRLWQLGRGDRVAAAPVVVLDTSRALLLPGDRSIEIEIEITAVRRCPWKAPPHTPLVRLQL